MTTQISGTTGIAASAAQFLVGQVIFTATAAAPTGFSKCNGAAVSRTVYASLFAAIGTTYGAGDGSTTFNLPELRGEFLRCADDGRGVDSGRTIGSTQSQSVQPHTHSIPGPETYTAGLGGGVYVNDALLNSKAGNGSTGSAGTTETRPRNVALLACIFTGV